MKIKHSTGDRIFIFLNYFFVGIMVLVTLFPVLHILSSSISSATEVMQGNIFLLPKGINFDAYKRVLEEREVWVGYKNTLWYVGVGTLINIVMTTLTAFPLSRRNFGARRPLMLLITFTMFFSGGMVPMFLLIRDLGMLDTRWAIVVPVAISTWNLIIMRTFFEGLPETLFEAAKLDGCNDIGILFRIVLPLSKAILAVMVLFYAVQHWNSYFSATMYLNKDTLQPLQVFLRKILIQYQQNESNSMVVGVNDNREAVSQTVRYAVIVVSTLPIVMVYPFLQKYFMGGVMIGAIKG